MDLGLSLPLRGVTGTSLASLPMDSCNASGTCCGVEDDEVPLLTLDLGGGRACTGAASWGCLAGWRETSTALFQDEGLRTAQAVLHRCCPCRGPQLRPCPPSPLPHPCPQPSTFPSDALEPCSREQQVTGHPATTRLLLCALKSSAAHAQAPHTSIRTHSPRPPRPALCQQSPFLHPSGSPSHDLLPLVPGHPLLGGAVASAPLLRPHPIRTPHPPRLHPPW